MKKELFVFFIHAWAITLRYIYMAQQHTKQNKNPIDSQHMTRYTVQIITTKEGEEKNKSYHLKTAVYIHTHTPNNNNKREEYFEVVSTEELPYETNPNHKT